MASDILLGATSAIAGARRIASLRFDAGLEDDRDVIPFVAVDSETDALPIGPAIRSLWQPKALERLQPAIDNAEGEALSDLRVHCQALVSRLGLGLAN